MPQDDTFVTPTTPTPTTPAQDDVSGQAWSTPAPADATSTDVLPTDVPADLSLPPVSPDPMPIVAQPTQPDPEPLPAAETSPVSDAVVMPNFDAPDAAQAISQGSSDTYSEVANRINEAKNVLIALSSDPSVDELSAAIGLSLYLDKIGKRATAIYSGSTPNALEFLKPEETFETSADTLQDFVIALNKDKADHLRYKIDGDYVKVYITPYKHRLAQEDLEFSYGDYNVDLVIALDVANGIDLDSALREHGRIMHDAIIVNVTTGNPGKFGEIEWSDKSASSVSEMIATLLYNYGGENPIAKDEATAYLTGIVAATNRFANAKTTPITMRLCSKLMESGANQQLISKNITPDIDNELFGFSSTSRLNSPNKASDDDPTKLDIEHEYETKDKDSTRTTEESNSSTSESTNEVDAEVTKKEHTLLDDLKAAEQSLAQASAETVPEDNGAALEINSDSSSDESLKTSSESSEPTLPQPVPDTPDLTAPDSLVTSESSDVPETPETPDPSTPSIVDTPEVTVAPSAGFSNETTIEDSDKYSQMLQDALDSVSSPVEPTEAIMSQPDIVDNPASANTPSVPSSPEINGVPEMSYTPAPEADILPPPPAPPVEIPQEANGLDTTLPVAGAPTTPLGSQPAMQDQVYRPQAADPGAFKIPGM